MHSTIPTTMTWWDQGGKPPRFPPSVSWVSQGESSSVNYFLSILVLSAPLISVLSTGLFSDFTKNKFGMPRSYCLILVAVMFFISQVVTGFIKDIAHLWIASTLVGLAYGSVWSLLPTVCLEWFGMRKSLLPLFFKKKKRNIECYLILSAHFSENLGFISLATIAGNLFSVMFGKNLDAHKSSPVHDTLLIPPPLPPSTSNIQLYSAPQCLLGLRCYLDSIYLTMLATFLAVLLSIWAGYRDRLKMGITPDKTCW